jgi:hypothetical protein
MGFFRCTAGASKNREKGWKTRAPNDNRTLSIARQSVEILCSANNLRTDLLRV